MSEESERYYDRALGAIQALFCDSSISQRETAESLNSLIGEIGIMLDSMDEDQGR